MIGERVVVAKVYEASIEGAGVAVFGVLGSLCIRSWFGRINSRGIEGCGR